MVKRTPTKPPPSRVEVLQCDICGERYKVINPSVAEVLRPVCPGCKPRPSRTVRQDVAAWQAFRARQDRARMEAN